MGRFLIEWWWLVAAIGLVVLIAWLKRVFAVAEAPPYERRDLLSAAELAFFRALEQASGEDYYLFVKIRLADLIGTPSGTENYRGWLSRVSQKHVDFVLCEREQVRPVLVVELDDRSHDRADRRERDEFVDRALAAAGIAILRVKAAKAYDVEQLSRWIEERAGG